MFDTDILDEALRSKQAQLCQEQTDLLARVQHSLQALHDSLGLEEAYIVGSLIIPGAWSPSSDVDVAVRGPSVDVLAVMKALEDATDRDVDVIDLDRHPAADEFIRSGLRVRHG